MLRDTNKRSSAGRVLPHERGDLKRTMQLVSALDYYSLDLTTLAIRGISVRLDRRGADESAFAQLTACGPLIQSIGVDMGSHSC